MKQTYCEVSGIEVGIKNETNKYLVPEWTAYFANAQTSIEQALDNYCINVFNYHDDVTKGQIKKEFWGRVAEHYGFEIKWKEEK